jgi:hypothetical protein
MPRYFFNIRQDKLLLKDDDAARQEAVASATQISTSNAPRARPQIEWLRPEGGGSPSSMTRARGGAKQHPGAGGQQHRGQSGCRGRMRQPKGAKPEMGKWLRETNRDARLEFLSARLQRPLADKLFRGPAGGEGVARTEVP